MRQNMVKHSMLLRQNDFVISAIKWLSGIGVNKFVDITGFIKFRKTSVTKHSKMTIMKTLLLALCIALAFLSFDTLAQIPPKDTQIKSALLAAPEHLRAECTVLGYDQSGNLVVLKEGTNNLICLADNPKRAGFDVACYHKDLNPFMARGRALVAQGKTTKEIFNLREKEAKSGALKMPTHPSTLYVFAGKNEQEATYRWVVYVPYATAESTGLSTAPLPGGAPWLMDAGTHRAHIMLTPTH